MHLTERFFKQAGKYGPRTVFAHRDASGWVTRSWDEVACEVRSVMAGLRDAGIMPGDRVLLLSENRPEWAVFDLAIMGVGALVVPAYTTHTTRDLAHILELVSPRAAIASSDELARRLIESAGGYQGLERLWVEAPSGLPAMTGLGGWSELFEVDGTDSQVEPSADDSTCCLIFTSGTSGLAKAAMLTHRSIGANVDGALTILNRHDFGQGDRFLSFLPLAHAYEHTAGLHMPIALGAEIWFCESTEKLQQYLPEVRPTLATAVPRLYDLLYSRIQGQLKSAPQSKRWLFGKTLELGKKRCRGQKLSLLESVLDRLLDRLVRSKVRARFGGRIRHFISGGAPLNPEVGEFFTALGVGIIQGYGQTEASPLISVNHPGRVKIDTVGLPLEGLEVRLADDGELLVKGDCVMVGYWEDPEATAAAIVDGWLLTGDLASIDDDGFIRIIGRKKDLIVTTGGDNVSPSKIETLLCSEPEIEQAVVFGDGRAWLGAVLVPGADVAGSTMVSDAVSRVNLRLNPSERVRKFLIQDEPCTTDNGLLTPTQKVKRGEVIERHRDAIGMIYGS